MKVKLIYVIVILLTLSFASCQKEEDVPPALTIDMEANMTISELLSLYSLNNATSYSEIPDGAIICGTVTSSDKEKNCYKYLTIEDETGGIMIMMKNTELYGKYPVGAKLFVKCGNMVVGQKYKNKQLALLSDSAMTGISRSDEDFYLFTDGKAGPEPMPRVISSRNQIDSTFFNCLVRLENVHVLDGGDDVYCSSETMTSHPVLMSDSTTVMLRTYARASFAHDALPIGSCDLIGILINSSSGPQLILRSLQDVRQH